MGSALDWYPTLLEAAGVQEPAKRSDGHPVDGRSILPVLLGESDGESREIVWRTGSHAELGRSSWAAARSGDWKWVRPPDSDGMLFDLASDPGEEIDVAEKYPDVASRLGRLATE